MDNLGRKGFGFGAERLSSMKFPQFHAEAEAFRRAQAGAAVPRRAQKAAARAAGAGRAG